MSHGGDIYSYEEKYGYKPLDFSANISPLGLSEYAKIVIKNSLETVHLYPDNNCTELKKLLSEKHKIDPDNIICGNGAGDLIYKICTALSPKNAMIVCPTFTEYEKALCINGTNIHRYILKETDNFKLTDDILNDITPDINLLVLCSPNNPTGQLIDFDLLTDIVEKCRTCGTYVLVDECFIDLTDSADTAFELLDYDNIIVLNAFTKSYGMAGLRLGYMETKNEYLLQDIHKISAPWSVSTLAQLAGVASLKDEDYLQNTKYLVRMGRSFLTHELDKLGLKAFPSDVNFIMFKSERTDLKTELEKRGAMIRQCEDFVGLNVHYYRIAVLDMNKNRQLVSCLKEVLDES